MFKIDPVEVLDAQPFEWYVRLAAAKIIGNDRENQSKPKPSILDSPMPDYG